MVAIDLNADLGELPGPGGAAVDDALLEVVSSANVATGGHAGDTESMTRVCRSARARRVAIGAHISYPDRAGFGRAPLAIAADDLAHSIRQQLDTLVAIAAECGTRVRYVKPHGALYNQAVADGSVARTVLHALRPYELPVLTLPQGELARRAAAAGVAAHGEAFADRHYEPDGTLRARRHSDALITDARAVRERALALAHRQPVPAVTGHPLHLDVASVCLHGDTPGAVDLARAVRTALDESGVVVAPFTSQPHLPYRQAGHDAVLVAITDAMRGSRLPTIPPAGSGIRELVPGADTVLVRFDPAFTDPRRVARVVAELHQRRGEKSRRHVIPVDYAGPDLSEVARATGLGVDEVVRRHSAVEYRAEFCGFSPGFAYLAGSDPLLHLPRRATPRTRVPAGSVAVADRFCAVYPRDSPGGWHLLGRTTARMFDAHRSEPALVRPGDTVRFEPAP